MNTEKKMILLLWKNYIYRKKHKIQTLVELLLPIILLLLLERFSFAPDASKVQTFESFNASFFNLPTSYNYVRKRQCPDKISISYSPDSRAVRNVVQKSMLYLLEQHIEATNITYFKECLFEYGDPHIKFDKYGIQWIFDKLFTLNAHHDSETLSMHLWKPTVSDIEMCGIEFDDSLKDLQRTNDWPEHTMLTLRFPSHFDWSTNMLYPIFPEPQIGNASKYGANPDYVGSNFISIAHSIIREITLLKSKPTVYPDIKMKRFPHVDDPGDDFDFTISRRLSMGLFIVLALSYTVSRVVKSITLEKEYKIKEFLEIMRLPNWLQWVTWFISTFCFMMIPIIEILILLTAYNFTYTSWHFFLIFLIIYTISIICFCFMMTTIFFKASNIAMVSTGLWMLSYLPYCLLSLNISIIPTFISNISACLSLNSAMGFGFEIILFYEKIGVGMQWSNLFTPIAPGYNLVMAHVMLMLLVDAIIYLVIALYVEQVSSDGFGNSNRWYFPVSSDFWNKTNNNKSEVWDEDILMENIASMTSEPDPIGLNVGIDIKNLSKSFNNHVAVNNLRLKIYQNQVTVLLGHNGSGKSTIFQMLTGMISPTSGTATVVGFDIRSEINRVQRFLSICPQEDILFPDLSVAEHMTFFARLKGIGKDRLHEHIEKYLRALNLNDKQNKTAINLSNDLKRRLSVCIALCGNSKIVLLDEPTLSMDPIASRQIWDLLQSEKHGRTIIVTTHFTDEAENFGERIAIMCEGNLKCVGSPFYLKKKLGIGYRLTIVRYIQPSNAPIIELLQKYVHDAKIYSEIGSEISFLLPGDCSHKFHEMLSELEDQQSDLGLISFGLTAYTLEDVFMKVDADLDDNNTFEDEDNFSNENSTSHRHTGVWLLLIHWKTMLLKKILMILRSWSTFLLYLLIPLIVCLATEFLQLTEDLPPRNLELRNGYQDSLTLLSFETSQRVYITKMQPKIKNEFYISEFIKAYESYFTSTPYQNMLLVNIDDNNMTSAYLNNHKSDFHSKRIKDLIGATVKNSEVIAWFSNTAYHDIAASLVLTQTAIMNALSKTKATFTLVNHPFPTISNKQEFVNKTFDHLVAFSITASMAFIMSYYLLLHVKEYKSGSKFQQILSGVSPITMWGSAFVIDLLSFVVIAVIMCLIILGTGSFHMTFNYLGVLVSLLLIFAWAALPLQYLLSTWFNTPGSAFVKMTVTNLLIGVVLLYFISMYMDVGWVSSAIHYVSLIFPHYCFGDALLNFIYLQDNVKWCNRICNKFNMADDCSNFDYCQISYIEEICCESGYLEAIRNDFIYLIIMGFVFIQLLFNREYKISECNRKYKDPVPLDLSTMDEDVYSEQLLVNNISEKDYHMYNLVCTNISKYDEKRLAINQFSIAVKEGESIGILGINGSGKSSLLRSLAGKSRIHLGNAWVKGFSTKNNVKTVHKHIGYCPQPDPLLEELTGRETLQMFSNLRGIPPKQQNIFINDISKKLGFDKDLDKPIKSISAGNKGKLSIAIALVGDPDVVYFDEPTTGLDPAAKRLVWKVISKCRCVILTSHSMEECEALCSRVVILNNGRPECIGSVQYLKNKFSEGYILMVKLQPAYSRNNNPRDFSELTQFVKDQFYSVEVMETRQDVVTYRLYNTRLKWSLIFKAMEYYKDLLKIEDYSIRQTSLDQIFLRLTSQREVLTMT